MEPSFYPNTDPAKPIRIFAVAAIGLLALLSGWMVFLTVAGYGTVTFDLPADATIKINGHTVTAHSLRLRSGSYQTEIQAPRSHYYQGTLAVGVRAHQTYRPTLSSRSVNQIFSSALGASGLYGPPGVTDVFWVTSSWVTGAVGPGNTSIVALHYSNSTWKVAYFADSTGYPHDKNALPSDVGAQVTQLEARYAGN